MDFTFSLHDEKEFTYDEIGRGKVYYFFGFVIHTITIISFMIITIIEVDQRFA